MSAPDQSNTPIASHRPGPRQPNPTVRTGELDGRPVVFVSLAGHRRGEMILSAARWAEVVRRWGPHWLLITGPTRKDCSIVSTSQDVAREAGVRCPRLARLLTGAGPRQRVRHLNGDPLDLRDDNLVLVTLKAPCERTGRPLKAPKPPKPRPANPMPPKTVSIGPLSQMALLAVRSRLRRALGRDVSAVEAVAYALTVAMQAPALVLPTPEQSLPTAA